jgi:hypothetical protein
MRKIIIIVAIISFCTNLFSQENLKLRTDIFGNRIYSNGNYEETFSIDIFGNNQYKNSRGETASLGKDIFNNMIYKDNRGNEISIDKDIWKTMLDNASGNVEELFLSFIIQNTDKTNSKTEFKIDIMGHEIFSENGYTEEIWKDIMDNWQYKNNKGQTATLRLDIFKHYEYSDSAGNTINLSSDTRSRHHHNRTGKNGAPLLRQLVYEYLLNN